ncbi:MAG: hypothetical protein KDE19_03655 [Caldilineaceae bacterium]|nr:hypothetical protein [Caldilineaceae bacterium]
MTQSPVFFLTQTGQAALDGAAAIAQSRQQQEVTPKDLLAALLLQQGTLVQRLFEQLQLDMEPLRQTVDAPAKLPRLRGEGPPLSTATSAIVGYASKEAQHLGHGHVDSIHLLMGMLYEQDQPGSRMLTDAGLSLYDLRRALASRPKQQVKQSTERPSLGAVRPSPIFLIPLLLMLGAGGALWTNPQDNWIKPLTFLFAIGGWVTALCIHEFGHALVAYFGGDTSVRDQGYLTLNPLKYTHPFYSLVIPLIFMFMGGIGLPGAAVYVNRFALRNAWWDRFTSAGGPLGTLVFIALTTWPFALDWQRWVTEENYFFWPALAFMGFLQVTALIFNLIPLPPLDGWGIISPSFSWETRVKVSQYGGFSLLLLFILLNSGSGITLWFWNSVFQVASWFNLPQSMIGQGFDQFMLW